MSRSRPHGFCGLWKGPFEEWATLGSELDSLGQCCTIEQQGVVLGLDSIHVNKVINNLMKLELILCLFLLDKIRLERDNLPYVTTCLYHTFLNLKVKPSNIINIGIFQPDDGIIFPKHVAQNKKRFNHQKSILKQFAKSPNYYVTDFHCLQVIDSNRDFCKILLSIQT